MMLQNVQALIILHTLGANGSMKMMLNGVLTVAFVIGDIEKYFPSHFSYRWLRFSRSAILHHIITLSEIPAARNDAQINQAIVRGKCIHF